MRYGSDALIGEGEGPHEGSLQLPMRAAGGMREVFFASPAFGAGKQEGQLGDKRELLLLQHTQNAQLSHPLQLLRMLPKHGPLLLRCRSCACLLHLRGNQRR